MQIMYQLCSSELMNELGDVVIDTPCGIRRKRVFREGLTARSPLVPAPMVRAPTWIMDHHHVSSGLLLAMEHVLSLLSHPGPFFVPGTFSATSSFFRLLIRL